MLYCKRVVDSVSDASYYLLVSMHSSDGDPEHSTSFDMQVTDGQSAWSQSGTFAFNTCYAMLPSPSGCVSSTELLLIWDRSSATKHTDC